MLVSIDQYNKEGNLIRSVGTFRIKKIETSFLSKKMSVKMSFGNLDNKIGFLKTLDNSYVRDLINFKKSPQAMNFLIIEIEDSLTSVSIIPDQNI